MNALRKGERELNSCINLLERARVMSLATKGKFSNDDAKKYCVDAEELIHRAMEMLEEAHMAQELGGHYEND